MTTDEGLIKADATICPLDHNSNAQSGGVELSAEHELKKALRRYELLASTAAKLLQSENPHSVIDTLCRETMQHIGCDLYLNYLTDSASGKLRLNAHGGMTEGEATEIAWLDLSSAICGSVAQQRKGVVLSDILTSEDPSTSHLRRLGVQSYISFPLLAPGGAVFGSLSFGNRLGQTFAESDLTLIQTIANLVATAIARIKVEQSLRESEERFRLALNSLPGVCVLYDKDRRFEFVNEAGRRLAGLRLDEILGKRDEEVWSSEITNEYLPHLLEVYRTKRPLQFEVSLTLNTGTLNTGTLNTGTLNTGALAARPLFHLIDYVPLLTEFGDIRQVLGIVQDLSDRKVAEARLYESNQKLLAVMEAVPVGISFSNDSSCKEITGNRRALELFGAKDGENLSASAVDPSVVGRSIRFFSRGKELTDRELPLQRAVMENRPIAAVEMEVLLQSGKRWWSETTSAPLLDSNGQVSGGVAVTVDITERKELENELIQAIRRAEEASTAKDHFLACLSHELRTPLSPIILSTQLLERRKDLPPQAREHLEVIKRNVQLEAQLVDDLLDLNRILHGKARIELQTTNVHECLLKAVEVCRGRIQDKGLHLTLDLAAHHPWSKADPARLQQIFWNLLINAVKFTPDDGTITVTSFHSDNGTVQVSIQDTGRGIASEQREKLFVAFEQGPGGGGGLGLGLAISKSLVELHGGSISVESNGPGQGSTFCVAFPVVSLSYEDRKNKDVRPKSIRSPSELEHYTPLPGNNNLALQRILLVEDNADTATLLLETIRSMGHEVVHASTVKEVVEIVEPTQFTMLLCDIGLPDGTGLDVIRWIGSPTLKSAAITGYGMEEDVRRCKEAGFLCHVTKPVSVESVERLINELILIEPS